jgi:septal ring factor EnvC (AmiA/AmiB activator)
MSELQKLPCPLCGSLLDIRKSVKGKPYTICDACGMQMFIRKAEGISALKRALEAASKSDLEKAPMQEKLRSLEKRLMEAETGAKQAAKVQAELSEAKRELSNKTQELTRVQNRVKALDEQISELKRSYFKTCPECAEEFRITEDLIKTSWFDGSFRGFRCPNENCQGVVPPEVEG